MVLSSCSTLSPDRVQSSPITNSAFLAGLELAMENLDTKDIVTLRYTCNRYRRVSQSQRIRHQPCASFCADV
uniref:F-box protein n=1 Tax=Litoreibacter albidus TaxID=670155 RepID=UPI0037366606